METEAVPEISLSTLWALASPSGASFFNSSDMASVIHPPDSTCDESQTGQQYHAKEDKAAEDEDEETAGGDPYTS